MTPFDLSSRRAFLGAATLPWLAPLAGLAGEKPQRKVRVAAIYTVLRFRSHAFNILESFLNPYLFNGKRIEPSCQVVSLYSDQRVPEGDMNDDVSRRYRIPLFKTISDALCVGGKELAVDAALVIGEHGEYPTNKLGQKEYPRKQFFDECVAVMHKARRFVPYFNDKHLSYRWDWAREMYDTAQKNRMPLMAGSSVPLAQRRPALELPANASIEEAVSIHGGAFETYDFHGLEVLQSLVEGRKGGESGVASIEFLSGNALWQAADKKRWSVPLAEAAMRAELGKDFGDLRKATGQTEPHGILVTYRDGLRATMLKIGASTVRWNFACKLAGDKRLHATSYYVGPWGNRNLFMGLSNAIQHHFVHGQSPYPVERTLLTTGMVEAAVRSRADGRALPTPHLQIAYAARDFRAFRESGASWKVLQGVAEPKVLNPTGQK
jgi:hypothetical protein